MSDQQTRKELFAREIAEKCSTCRAVATHWTAEVNDREAHMITWCDECWDIWLFMLGGPHPFEVPQAEWIRIAEGLPPARLWKAR